MSIASWMRAYWGWDHRQKNLLEEYFKQERIEVWRE
jgi:hypothetical protein